MRQIGSLPNFAHAQRFVDYLLTTGVSALAEEETKDRWVVWVHEEEQVTTAATELREFQAQPDDARYAAAPGKAQDIRQRQRDRQAATAKNVHHMRANWNRGLTRKAPVTFLLIAACAAVFMLNHMATPSVSDATYRLLAFRAPPTTAESLSDNNPFRDIQGGQLWRLVTPIFMHADAMHIFFNLYMLYYFGGQFEQRRGGMYLLVLVILSAATSNVAQVTLTGPNVIGISGVVYALLGYVWMQSTFLPKSGFYVGQFTILLAIGWLFVGFLPFEQFANIAHAAHGAGLFFGVVVGYLAVLFPSLEGKI